jgi:hypothetical protein
MQYAGRQDGKTHDDKTTPSSNRSLWDKSLWIVVCGRQRTLSNIARKPTNVGRQTSSKRPGITTMATLRCSDGYIATLQLATLCSSNGYSCGATMMVKLQLAMLRRCNTRRYGTAKKQIFFFSSYLTFAYCLLNVRLHCSSPCKSIIERKRKR